MFLASDVIKRHFGAHTESQESSSLPAAKHFLGLCVAKRRLMFLNFVFHTFFFFLLHMKNFVCHIYSLHPIQTYNVLQDQVKISTLS